MASNGAGATIRATGVTAGAPEEPLRTAVRAETAKSGHTLHPSICRSDAPELVVVVVACGGHGEAMCKSELSCRGWKCNHPGERERVRETPKKYREKIIYFSRGARRSETEYRDREFTEITN